MPKLTEDFEVTTDVKTIIAFVVMLSAGIFGWSDLKGDIDDAKGLPEAPVTRIEYDLKDRLIRQTITDLSEDVEDLEKEIKELKQMIQDLDR